MSRRTTFTVGCSMEPDQYLPFLAGSVIEAVGTHASVAGLERLREARAKLDHLIRTLEQLEQEQKEVHDRDLRNIQAQQQHDMAGDCSRKLESLRTGGMVSPGARLSAWPFKGNRHE